MFQDNLQKKFSNFYKYLLGIGLILPVLFYIILPFLGIDKAAEIFTPEKICLSVLKLIGLCVFIYFSYKSATKFLVVPIIILFLYQTLFIKWPLLFPNISINFRSITLLFILPVLLVSFHKYRVKPFLKPYIYLFGFYIMNLIYTLINYAHTPSILYNPEVYLKHAYSLIPRIYSIDFLIFLSFLFIAVYLTLNLFSFEKANVQKNFDMFLCFFVLIYCITCLVGYILNMPECYMVITGIKRLSGFTQHPNIFGFSMVTISLYIISFLYEKTYKDHKFMEILAKISLGSAFLAIFLTYSRINNSLILGLLGLNMILLSRNKLKAVLNLGLISVFIVIAVFILAGVNNTDIIGSIGERIKDDSSTNFRPMVWNYLSSQLYWDWRIIFGQGIGAAGETLLNFFASRFYFNLGPIVYHPHNSYWLLFFDYGLAGLFFYTGSLVSLVIISAKRLICNKKINIKALFLIEIIVFAMLSAVIDNFLLQFEVISFWIIVCILYANIFYPENEANNRKKYG